MINLDDIEKMRSLDTENQLGVIASWPKLMEDGFYRGKEVKLSQAVKDRVTSGARLVCVCGMGGSAISGEYLSDYLSKNSFGTPILVVRGYSLPSYVGEDCLVIAISYSGNTRETLVLLHKALEKNIPSVIISSGGIAAEAARKRGLTLATLPGGYPPRAAFPIIFSTLCGVFEKLFPSQTLLEKDFLSTLPSLEEATSELSLDIPAASNRAKQTALSWRSLIPVFITSYPSLGMRMKGQMNENSKKIAYFDLFPELMHNSAQGWKDGSVKDFLFIRIKVGTEAEELIEKTKYALELATGNGEPKLDTLLFEGSNLLSCLLHATQFVDYVSLYLAVLQGYDPSEMDIISGMKKEFELKLNRQFDVRQELLS